jgi:hypothetical protein
MADLSFREKIKLAESLCEQESAKILEKYGKTFEFCHYDPEVSTLFVKEISNGDFIVTHEMLAELSERVKSTIDAKWYIGLINSPGGIESETKKE